MEFRRVLFRSRALRDHHASAGARSDHRVALSASITAAMIGGSAPGAIFTATPSISSSTALVWDRRRRRGRMAVATGSPEGAGSITAGTNEGAGAGTIGKIGRAHG